MLFVDHESQNSKPPTGRKMALDLSSTSRSSASRTQQKLSPSINFSSRRSSGRAEPVASDRVNTELYSSRQQSGRSQSSGRVALTPTEKRAERERLEEINLVRQLQEL